jgi:hypothetical protein
MSLSRKEMSSMPPPRMGAPAKPKNAKATLGRILKYLVGQNKILLLLVLLIATLFRASYLDRTVAHIIDTLDKLSSDFIPDKEEIVALRAFWEERKQMLKFTMSDSSLNTI